jgi:hypothetical protein
MSLNEIDKAVYGVKEISLLVDENIVTGSLNQRQEVVRAIQYSNRNWTRNRPTVVRKRSFPSLGNFFATH